MPIEPADRQRLSRLMEDRMLELNLTWQEVALRGDISLRAIASARTGPGDIRVRTRRAIDRGLQWTEGRGVDNILAGRDPEPADLFLAEVLREIDTAVRAHGGTAAEHLPGAEIFHGQPWSHIEATVWDDARVSLDLKARVIASMRAEQARYEAGRNPSRRSGTAGLALVTSGGP